MDAAMMQAAIAKTLRDLLGGMSLVPVQPPPHLLPTQIDQPKCTGSESKGPRASPGPSWPSPYRRMYMLIHAQKIDGEPFPAARYTIVLSWLIECHPRSPETANWRTEN